MVMMSEWVGDEMEVFDDTSKVYDKSQWHVSDMWKVYIHHVKAWKQSNATLVSLLHHLHDHDNGIIRLAMQSGLHLRGSSLEISVIAKKPVVNV